MFQFSYQQSKSSPTTLATREIFDAALDDHRVALICRRISEQSLGLSSQDDSINKLAQEKISALKATLPAFCWHATFKDNKRNAQNAIPSGLVMLDVDHIESPEQTFNEIKDKALTLNLVAAHITPSTKGLRLVFIIPQGMTIPDAQSYLAQQLNLDNVDLCVKDLSRISYIVPRDYWLYINYDALFANEYERDTPQPSVETEPAPSQTPPQKISRSDRPDTPNASVNEPSASSASLRDTTTPEASKPSLRDTPTPEVSNPPLHDPYPSDYRGIPYATIVSNLEAVFGGKPAHGDRNSTIYGMAGQLRHICNNDPDWIAQILPTYGENQSKWYATIKSACNKSVLAEIPSQLKRALEMSKTQDELQSQITRVGSTIFSSELPPEMPKRLPKLIAHVIQNVPEASHAAVAESIFPALATHLFKVRFPLVDGTFRIPILMCILMAPQSSGKSGINIPIDRIMDDIVERDKINRQREQDWKDAYNSKANSKEKPKRPDDLCVQKLAPDFTNASMVLSLKDAGGRSVFSRMDEIEMLSQIKDWSKWLRLSFDGAEYGQERVGPMSVTAIVNMLWNIVACTTPQRGLPFFSKHLVDGTLSRLSFATIIADKSKDYVYGNYTADYAMKLKPYISNLNLASGDIHCPKALALARSLQKKCIELCEMADDDVLVDFVYRAVTIAYTKAMILYIAQDMTWDKTLEDYMEWSLFYDLWNKNYFFGSLIAEANAIANAVGHRGRTNLLNSLPDTFTRAQAEEVRRVNGLKPNPKQMLANWIHRKFIVFNETTQLYEKTAKYKLGTN